MNKRIRKKKRKQRERILKDQKIITDAFVQWFCDPVPFIHEVLSPYEA